MRRTGSPRRLLLTPLATFCSTADEYQGKAVAHNVVKIHDVVKAVRRRHFDEASVFPVGHFDYSQAAFWQAQAVGRLCLLYQEIYSVVLKLADFVDFGEPDGVCIAVKALVVEVLEEDLLLFVELRFVKKSYVVLLQCLEHFVYCDGVFLAELRVELVYCLDGFAYVVVLLAYFLVVRLKQAVE